MIPATLLAALVLLPVACSDSTVPSIRAVAVAAGPPGRVARMENRM
jgi:hypothetical protein